MTQSRRLWAASGSDQKLEVDWQAALVQHDRWLRTVVYTRLYDRDATDELMQEIALCAIRQAAPLRDASKVAPWLYRLAIRRVLLYRRQRGRQRKLLNRYAEHVAPAAAESLPDPCDWLLAVERGRLVREALRRLPERDAEVLMLKYTELWSYTQIAAHLGVSTSAVEARLHRARGRLRGELAATGLVEVR